MPEQNVGESEKPFKEQFGDLCEKRARLLVQEKALISTGMGLSPQAKEYKAQSVTLLDEARSLAIRQVLTSDPEERISVMEDILWRGKKRSTVSLINRGGTENFFPNELDFATDVLVSALNEATKPPVTPKAE